MRTKQQVQAIISRLEEEYPLAECSLQYEKDYELLFATRLSAQCTDERVNKVTPALFERFPTLQSLAEAEVSEVEQYIHSCGFYHGKARDIVACSKVLLEEYDGMVHAFFFGKKLTDLLPEKPDPRTRHMNQAGSSGSICPGTGSTWILPRWRTSVRTFPAPRFFSVPTAAIRTLSPAWSSVSWRGSLTAASFQS